MAEENSEALLAERGRRGAWTHLPAIDGLRALAVTGVVLYHAGVPWLRGGFLGVDLFFVISGWLITSLLLGEMETHRGVQLGEFWARRARRLLPAAIAMIAVVVGWWTLRGTVGERLTVLDDAPWGLFYVANWHEIGEGAGYWAASESPSPLAHLWSLAIEEQFYLVWPLVVAAVARWASRRQSTLLVVAGAGIIASFFASVLLFDAGAPDRAYMGTDTRASSILIGAALAAAPMRIAVDRLVERIGRWRELAATSALVAVVAMWVFGGAGSGAWLFHGGLLVHAALGGLLVVTVGVHGNGRIGAALGHPVAQWLGLRSYGVYLWHWPVFVWFDAQRTGFDGVTLFVGRIALTLVATELSYRLVEAPVRWRVGWARRRDGVVVAASSILALGALVSLMPRPADEVRMVMAGDAGPFLLVERPRILSPGAAEVRSRPAGTAAVPAPRVDDPVASDTPPGDTAPGESAAGGTTAGHTTAARTTAGDAATGDAPTGGRRLEVRSIQWFGDSVADDLAPAVEAAFETAGVSVTSRAFPGQSLTGGLMLDRGELWLYDELPGMLEQEDADVAVWVLSHWDFDADPTIAYDAHRTFVELALEHHRAVVFVGSPPMGPAEYEEGRVRLEESVSSLAGEFAGRVSFVDTTAVWGDEFAAEDGSGMPLRKPDRIHVCPLGASRLAAFLAVDFAGRFDGITPGAPQSWAFGDWWDDKRYRTPAGACA